MTADSQIEIRKTAVIGVIRDGEKYLVIERSSRVRAPNRWCFPGGTVEKNESIPDALIRELKEELSLSVIPEKEVWVSITPWRTKLHWWLTTVSDMEKISPCPYEVEDYGWLTLRELQSHPKVLESNHQFLTLALSGEINLDGTCD